jgi:hypothetical protein
VWLRLLLLLWCRRLWLLLLLAESHLAQQLLLHNWGIQYRLHRRSELAGQQGCGSNQGTGASQL